MSWPIFIPTASPPILQSSASYSPPPIPNSNTQAPNSNLQLPTPNSQRPTSNSRLQTPDSRLQTPDSRLPNKYVILRFVSWSASHDIGHKGMSYDKKLEAVKAFSPYAKVFISSEAPLPSDLESFRFLLSPHYMHDALAFSSLVFGESATMAEEAAILCVPSVYLFNNSTYYTQHLEKDYRLMYNFSESATDQFKAIQKGVELLRKTNLKEEWQQKRSKMLADKIDVTSFLIWFVENWPESFRMMKEKPEYQYKFK